MKRILLWTMSTLTVLILLFGYHTSTSSRYPVAAENAAIAPISGGSATTGTAGAGGSGSSGGGSTAAAGSTPSTAPSTTGAAATVTGSVAQTRWGPVQVQITVAGGRITDVAVLQYPHENGKDEQINARALPILIDETLTAQNADIDMVSGATITSQGYVDSLQSALDRAGP